MRRELKFRVWAIEAKRWLTVREYSVDKMGNLYPFGISPESVIIQEFAGIYDINNKLIYEGDIIKQYIDTNDDPNSMVSRYKWSERKWKVVWCDIQHRFGLIELNSKYKELVEHLHHGNKSDHIKIIGNIFEKLY